MPHRPEYFVGVLERCLGNERCLRRRWFHTGNIGYLDEDGFLYITDRKKALISKGGENMSPREIEEVLYLRPAVVEAADVRVFDATYGEEICAVIQTGPVGGQWR